MPAVFTIGPHDDKASLEKYAVLLTGDADGGQAATARAKTVGTGRNHVQDIVKGIIEGETRSIVSNMTMEELFNNRRLFKAQVSFRPPSHPVIHERINANANPRSSNASKRSSTNSVCVSTTPTSKSSKTWASPGTSNPSPVKPTKVLKARLKSTLPTPV